MIIIPVAGTVYSWTCPMVINKNITVKQRGNND